MFKSIIIKGYRGFADTQALDLAIPCNRKGSGLTIIVGPNSSGKSTIYESFRAISQGNPPSFTESKRNKSTDKRISIKLINNDRHALELKTVEGGGSETEFIESGLEKDKVVIYTLPSRRTFTPFFYKFENERTNYIKFNNILPPTRGKGLENYSARLFNIQKNQTEFNKKLRKVIPNIPQWYIEQNDEGNYYLKFEEGEISHNSDGTGEGIISVFTIVDALYDSKEGDLVVIDEPELSLHPSLQKRIMDLICEYANDRQIIISTHSPYFIKWDILINGAKLARTVKINGKINIYSLKETTIKKITPLLGNLNNPHILGTDAKEIFFLDDNIILVEGQEDVVFYNQILKILEIALDGTFYGWGVGGASNITLVASILSDLGFKNVVIILDGNVKEVEIKCKKNFPTYKIYTIPANDVRDKAGREIQAVEGLIDTKGQTIKPKYKEPLIDMFKNINNNFS